MEIQVLVKPQGKVSDRSSARIHLAWVYNASSLRILNLRRQDYAI